MKKSILVMALFGLIFTLTSCQEAENITIEKYFQAMQVNDTDTMAAMAVSPKALQFKAFQITSVDPPTTTELQLPVLQKKLQDLTQQRKDQVMAAMDKRDELDDLEFELEETRRRAKRKELETKIEEVKVALATEEQKVKDIQLGINKGKQAIDVEKSMIRMSTGMDKNLEMYSGQTHIYKALVNVTTPDGGSKDYVFMLRKDVMKIQDSERAGRLIITGIDTVQDWEAAQKAQKEEPAPPAPAAEEKPAEEAPATEEAEEAKTEENK